MFYPLKLKSNYISAGTWPGDAVDIGDDVVSVFNGTPPEGKMRVAGEDGLPAWADIPPPTREELIASTEATKLRLKALADSEIAWRQDAVDAGIATEEETAALADWKKYRVLLMRVDTAKPVWPTPPGEQAR
ncbi:tail fiber assembly protein [Citrobacter freundii]|uniref:tail fiber assembly protein n=1 Tax=Citrobacter freundii TaxID=546 RepID=UPI003F8DC83B